MGTFRCRTCLAVFADPHRGRCECCRRRTPRQGPIVLRSDARLDATLLPIDRLLQARLEQTQGFTVPVAASSDERAAHQSPAPQSPAPQPVATDTTIPDALIGA